MIVIDSFAQNTPKWMAARLGNPGASGASNIITSKGNRSESRDGYLLDLALEIKTGRQANTFSSWKMEQGHVNEEMSRKEYAFNHRCDVIQVALCYKDEQKKFHCSPDGLRPDVKIGFETKDHTFTPRIQWEQYKKPVPAGDWIQCQMSLLVTEYNAWDYQAFCLGMELFEARIYPDDKFLVKLEKELDEFCLELAMQVKRIKEASE